MTNLYISTTHHRPFIFLKSRQLSVQTQELVLVTQLVSYVSYRIHLPPFSQLADRERTSLPKSNSTVTDTRYRLYTMTVPPLSQPPAGGQVVIDYNAIS